MLVPDRIPRVLAIGAHPDDIEIGAGGYIHRLKQKCQAAVHYLILTEGLQGLTLQPNGDGASQRRYEAQAAAEVLGISPDAVEVLGYPDCRLHEHGHALLREIERRLFDEQGIPKYDVVLTHCREDDHADHRILYESTVSAVRNFHGSVLFYQSPSVRPNGFRPTFFVRLDEADVARKYEAIYAHVSQRGRQFMTARRTHGLADNWAIFLRQPEGTFLEAFEVYKSFF
jgi:LmbE family N-acetylglucosaminyl deacetylase